MSIRTQRAAKEPAGLAGHREARREGDLSEDMERGRGGDKETPRERPILMTGSMVHQTLADLKRHTRRVEKDFPNYGHVQMLRTGVVEWTKDGGFDHGLISKVCPYGVPGDRLWVRERFYADLREKDVANPAVIYAATPELAKCKADAAPRHCTFIDGTPVTRADAERNLSGHRFQRLKPSIHMPRWASRLTLEIVNVRVERVQEISVEDAIAEGIEPAGQVWRDRRGSDEKVVLARALWDSINAQRGFGWDVNPWVWVIEFRRIQP